MSVRNVRWKNPSLETLKEKLREFSYLHLSPALHVEKNNNYVTEIQGTKWTLKVCVLQLFLQQSLYYRQGNMVKLHNAVTRKISTREMDVFYITFLHAGDFCNPFLLKYIKSPVSQTSPNTTTFLVIYESSSPTTLDP